VTTDEIDRVVHEATIAAGAKFDKFHFWNTLFSFFPALFIELVDFPCVARVLRNTIYIWLKVLSTIKIIILPRIINFDQ
jgi:hypothetical protein